MVTKTLIFYSQGDIFSLVLTPDDKYLISASWDCSIKVWNLETTKCVHIIKGAHKGTNENKFIL